MVINAVDNSKFGPGGSTQHLHHFVFQNLVNVLLHLKRQKLGVTQLSTDLKNYRLCPVEKLPVSRLAAMRKRMTFVQKQ